MEIVTGIVAGLVFLAILLWLGLKVKPKPFAPYAVPAPEAVTVPLPGGLPAPVERFYRALYGDRVPVIHSAVISGRARLRVRAITFPGRFRFIHDAGKDYRHYIEATLFGLPIMKVNEWYLDGRSRLKLPMGVVENEPKVDSAANLGLWAESLWLPALYLTDPRVRWEPVDGETALLRVPHGQGERTFVVRFEPQTGMIRLLESMRWKEASAGSKTLWINEALEVGELDGQRTMLSGALTWLDEGTPWAVFTVDEIVFNTNVSAYVRAAGP